MAQWLFVLTLLIALLIDTMVALAIWRPEWNLWPPPGKSSWQYRLIWTLYTLLLPGALALALVDAETLPLDAWIGHATHLLVGGALVAGGSALALWGIHTLTFYASLGLEAQLVTGGPYQYTRNPQYVGDMALALGLAVLSASVLTTLVALATAVGFVLVPFAEEPWLEDHYGAAYVRYRERVPRFLGRGASAQGKVEQA